MHRLTKRGLRVLSRTCGPLLPPGLLARAYPDVPGRIHIDDQMLRSDAPDHVRHYLTDGLSAIANIEASLRAAESDFADVRAYLDLPSGYGRVLRHLVRRIPPARVTACDVDPQAIRFCRVEFGVRALRSRRDLRQLRLPATYDLVFVGSLLTHLDPADAVVLLDLLAAGLTPGGQLIFTTQGASCLEHLDWYGAYFAGASATYRARVGRDGVCFLPYPRRSAYGITIHAREYVETLLARRYAPRLRLVRFAERGWDAHQDVWSVQRSV